MLIRQKPAPPWLRRLLKFGVTGVAATAIHVVVAMLLITQMAVPPYIANPIAFVVATCFSYAANTLWSFASRMSHRTLWRYIGASGLSCLATAAISAAAQAAHLDYRIGIALVVVLIAPMNFTMHSLWTYRSPQQTHDAPNSLTKT
jgi:putative flippase GtrA